MHDDELRIDVELVRALVATTGAGLGELAIRPLRASGSSNALFRLGEDLVARLPRQPGGSAAIVKEARWTPRAAAGLPVRVPEVVVVGEPGFGYPERWSITRWIDGQTPDPAAPVGVPDELVRDLAGVVRALREQPVPHAALQDPELRSYRAGPPAAIDDEIRAYLAQCRQLPDVPLDLDVVERVWADATGLPRADEAAPPPHWVHGDLLAENLLVRDGRLVAVLDFGGLAVGDPAVDLVAAWELFDAPAREEFRRATGVDDATWLRGRGWALAVAVMTLPYYWRSMPDRCASRLVMARAVLADAQA